MDLGSMIAAQKRGDAARAASEAWGKRPNMVARQLDRLKYGEVLVLSPFTVSKKDVGLYLVSEAGAPPGVMEHGAALERIAGGMSGIGHIHKRGRPKGKKGRARSRRSRA